MVILKTSTVARKLFSFRSKTTTKQWEIRSVFWLLYFDLCMSKGEQNNVL